MAETPTPRTDVAIAERQREIWQGEKPVGSIRTVNSDRMAEVETDLQHIARVSESALKLCVEALEPSDTLRHICPEFPGLDAARAALSEITRIQNQTI